MKHIILPVMDGRYDDDTFFRGLDDGLVREQFFLIDPTNPDDHQIADVKGRRTRTYLIGKNTDWDDVFGNIQSAFLGTDYTFQLDLVVDAGGSARAVSVMKALQPVFPSIGLTVSVKVIFLADARFEHYQEEQSFYNALKQAVFDAEKGVFSLKFNCAYLMVAQNESQQVLRERILPYMILVDSMMSNPEIRTCGGQIRDLDINSIELVPKDLAVKTVCAMLGTQPIDNSIAMFFMATGSTVNKAPREQLQLFCEKLEELTPVRLPAPVDLLVHKGSPDGDISTRDLFERFCKENPYSDPRMYDKASLEDLVRIPPVVNAVYQWENAVVQQACEKGDLSVYINQLCRGSEFDLLLAEYQAPQLMTSDKTLTEKDGYTETALQKLDQYAINLQQMIRNAIFSARLRLIYSRLPAVRARLEAVQKSRKSAVNNALATSMTRDETGLIEKWCKSISMELTNAAATIRLPEEKENVKDWIDHNTEELLKAISAPDYESGRKELAASGARIISSMEADTDAKLITGVLIHAIDVPLPPRWIVYQQMTTSKENLRTSEPTIIKIVEWYLNLHQCVNMDETVFLKPLAGVTLQVSESSGQTGKKQREEAAEDTVPLILQEEENLAPYTGELTWVWKDMRYTNARLEVYADTGVPGDGKEPAFSVPVRYKSDDHYSIGRAEELPSGVPLTFRIVYLDRGKDVTDISHEFRMRAPKSRLEVELLQVREGKFLQKKPYNRLKIKNAGSFFPDHIVVSSSTGHIYTARWESSGDGWLSELLPDAENWQVADRPGDLIEYEIIQ